MAVVMNTFLLVDDGVFSALGDVRRFEGEWSHVRGSVELLIGGDEVMGRDIWDDLDDLWPYVGIVVDDLLADGAGEIFFPSQPITLRAERLGGSSVRVSLTARNLDRAAVCDIGPLVAEVARAGRQYVQDVRRLTGSLSPTEEELANRIDRWDVDGAAR